MYFLIFLCFCIFLPWQAYLEEIKEMAEEETKKKSDEVKIQAEETAEVKKTDDLVEEKTILLESQAKKIILETTFENPNLTEIQQIVKNEPKPMWEKKED